MTPRSVSPPPAAAPQSSSDPSRSSRPAGARPGAGTSSPGHTRAGDPAGEPSGPAAGDPAAGLPEPPPQAAAVLGAGLAQACRYAGWLAGPGVQRGLLGPREVPRLWDRHLLNCAVVAELVPAGARVVDVGSGAGLPGIPLAIARPDLSVVLVEPLLRRATFLSEVVADLDLGARVEVQRARAEDLAGMPRADVLTARAVAPLDRLVRWAWPLVRPGGVLLAVKGSTAGAELEAARPRLPPDLTEASVVRCGGAVLSEPTTVVRLVRGVPSSSRTARGGRRR